MEKDKYCSWLLQHIDNSQSLYGIVLENLIEEKDIHNLMDKVEVIKGRLDVTWRGKETITMNNGDYWIRSKDHMDTDGNIALFYNEMILN